MTPEQEKALTYLAGRTWGAASGDVAYAMWPNSPSWNSEKHPGVGARFAACSLLNRLIAEGWVIKDDHEPASYTLTRLGVGAVNATKNSRQRKSAQRVHQSRRPCGSTLGTAKRAWKEVTCPACRRHRSRSTSKTVRSRR